ncbi:MAG: hypothetical protein AAF202_06395, partial [Pseudomonadota bacterium]
PGYRIEKSGGEDGDGFVEEIDFFKALDQKVIYIGNHHDLTAHLIQFADPKTRVLTERIARAYVRSTRIQSSLPGVPGHELRQKLMYLLNSLWLATQENSPVLYSERDGKQALAILGGFSSSLLPDYLSKEELDKDVSYFYIFNQSLSDNFESIDQIMRWFHPSASDLTKAFAVQFFRWVRKHVSSPDSHSVLEAAKLDGSRFPFQLEEDVSGRLELDKPWREEFDERIFDRAYESARTAFATLHPDEAGEEAKSLNFGRLMRVALASEMRTRDTETPTGRMLTTQMRNEFVETLLNFLEATLDRLPNE